MGNNHETTNADVESQLPLELEPDDFLDFSPRDLNPRIEEEDENGEFEDANDHEEPTWEPDLERAEDTSDLKARPELVTAEDPQEELADEETPEIDYRDSETLYRDQIFGHDLLEQSEIRYLCRLYQYGEKCQRYLDEKNDLHPALVAQLDSGVIRGKAAIRRIIKHNMRLVSNVVFHGNNGSGYLGLGIPALDLIQQGATSFYRSAKKFDPLHQPRKETDHREDKTKPLKFSTYATYWIRQHVTRSIHEEGNDIRIPTHLHEKLGKGRRALNSFMASHSRMPTTSEWKLLLIEEQGLTEKEAQTVVTVLSQGMLSLVSLDMPVTENDESMTLGEVTPSPGNVEDDALNHISKVEVEKILDQIYGLLNAREARVIQMRFFPTDEQRIEAEEYGSPRKKKKNDKGEVTLDYIAQKYGYTREAIRLVEKSALKKIRRRSDLANAFRVAIRG